MWDESKLKLWRINQLVRPHVGTNRRQAHQANECVHNNMISVLVQLSPCTRFQPGHILKMLFKHPSYPATQGLWKKYRSWIIVSRHTCKTCKKKRLYALFVYFSMQSNHSFFKNPTERVIFNFLLNALTEICNVVTTE